jgi:excisionase family DNA binding protein
MADRTLVSMAEAAAMLGVSRFTVRTWLRARRLPFYRLGRRVVIDAQDVEAFLARGRVEATVSVADHAA